MSRLFVGGKHYKVTEEGIADTMERIGLPREFAGTMSDIFNLEFDTLSENIIDEGFGYDLGGLLIHINWTEEI